LGERERETERQRQTETDRQTERERERQRERDRLFPTLGTRLKTYLKKRVAQPILRKTTVTCPFQMNSMTAVVFSGGCELAEEGCHSFHKTDRYRHVGYYRL
jgi:hypothetical protein